MSNDAEHLSLTSAEPQHLPAQEGFLHLSGFFSEPDQVTLLDAVNSVAAEAPFAIPCFRFGQPFRVEMTSAGAVGWWSDRRGFRYIERHPQTEMPWPPIPAAIRQAIEGILAVASEQYPLPAFHPDSCLINRYGPDGRLGLHVDEDEQDLDAPILSISLGDDAHFALGGENRKDPRRPLILRSGDVIVMAGPARKCFHEIKKIVPGTSRLVSGGGRINLTIRQMWPR